MKTKMPKNAIDALRREMLRYMARYSLSQVAMAARLRMSSSSVGAFARGETALNARAMQALTVILRRDKSANAGKRVPPAKRIKRTGRPLAVEPKTDNARVRELRASGMTLKQIGKRFGISQSRVSRIVSKTDEKKQGS